MVITGHIQPFFRFPVPVPHIPVGDQDSAEAELTVRERACGVAEFVAVFRGVDKIIPPVDFSDGRRLIEGVAVKIAVRRRVELAGDNASDFPVHRQHIFSQYHGICPHQRIFQPADFLGLRRNIIW